MKNKMGVVLIVLLLIVLGVESYFCYQIYEMSKEKEVNYMNILKDEEIKEESDISNLYHLTYLDSTNSDLYIYDIYITANWDVKINYLKITPENENYWEEILNKTEYKTIFNLNQDQRSLVQKSFDNIHYDIELGSDFTLNVGEYSIIDYKINKGALCNIVNDQASFIVMGLVYNNLEYFDYLQKDNDLKKYIQDTDYKELDINSTKIQNLYNLLEKDYSLGYINDYYLNEEFNNNSIISLTLLNGEDGIIEYEVKNPESMRLDVDLTYYVYNMSSFDKRAKEIWGPNVKYDIESYTGTSSNYAYSDEEKALIKDFRDGLELDREMLRKLYYAYETNDKIVLIEGGLYFEILGTLAKRGIYNNPKDLLLIENFYYNDYEYEYYKNIDLLDTYQQFVTYYSFTFNKSSDGKYYLTSFNRLN